MAKREREQAVKERRERKQQKKQAVAQARAESVAPVQPAERDVEA